MQEEINMKAVCYIYEGENKREAFDLNEIAKKEKELSKNGCPSCRREVKSTAFLRDGFTVAGTFCSSCKKVFTMVLY
jgi:hypothetical protein